MVRFSHYRADNFYYDIVNGDEIGGFDPGFVYQFPVPIDDVGNATLLAEDKAITFMRWIRQAIDNHTLIKL